jgi:hypothetical protein
MNEKLQDYIQNQPNNRKIKEQLDICRREFMSIKKKGKLYFIHLECGAEDIEVEYRGAAFKLDSFIYDQFT